jgi:uracil-DNA glycosylase
MDRDQLTEHLRFAAELGVGGISREPQWRTRTDSRVRMPEVFMPDPATGDNNKSGTSTTLVPAAQGSGGPPLDAAGSLTQLRDFIGPDCSRCKLHQLGRTQVVFGVGNPQANLMFVGEAPGGDEDIQGIPFVGRAGQLLTKIIEAIELKREDVYIANVIKCRPPQNRNPEPDEVETCEPFLFQQIDIIRPIVIVALGKFAAQALLRTLDPISRLRGRVFEYRGATLVPTFHPAYLLRNPSSKREVWEDMKLVKRLLAEGRSGKEG